MPTDRCIVSQESSVPDTEGRIEAPAGQTTCSGREGPTMRRTRVAQLAAIVIATLSLASLAVVSSKSHEQDDAPAKGQLGPAGPRRDAAVVMPPGLLGLQITLGPTDPQ